MRFVRSTLGMQLLSATAVVAAAALAASTARASADPSSLAASRAPGAAVVVTWRAAHGARLSGFNVYRRSGAARVRLNRSLVVESGPFGGSYRFVDRHAPSTATRYWVEAVDAGGRRTWLGSVSAEHALP